MIEDAETGDCITTEVLPVVAGDIRTLGPGWKFDWRAEVKRVEVFKLIQLAAPEAILGLMALRRHPNYVEVTLLESHPQHVGKAKRFLGIAGSLLAFAAQLSFVNGGEGFIAIDAKNELIEHYQQVYGFERLGKSQRLILATEAAARLIEKYVGRHPNA